MVKINLNLNVSNIKLLNILNKNVFNTKSKFLALIDKISILIIQIENLQQLKKILI